VISTTSGFNAKNAALARTPIYVFAIGGQATVYSTHNLAKMGVTGTLPAYETWLRVPTGATQSIDVQGGTSSIGEMECEVVDYGGAVRSLVGSVTLEGSSATLLVGYPGTAYTDFATLNVYTLYKVIPSQSYSSYLFRSKDIQIDVRQTIWNNPLNGYPLAADNPWIIQGTPCEIVQAICLLGLAMDASKVDSAGLVQLDSAAENLYGCARPYLFQEYQPFQAKDFLENQIYKSAGMYPVVNNLGQYSVRACRAPAAGASAVFAFTQNNIIGLPTFDRANILNDLLWTYDADDQQQNYASTALYLDATSIGEFGISNERQVRSNGLRTELGAQWFIQDISGRMFARFAGTTGLRGGAPLLTVNAFLLTLPVWVGDYVTVTHPLMPNLFTGGLGITNRLFEIISRSPDYANGKMQYQLLDTGLTGASAAAQFNTAVIDTALIY